MCRNYVVLKNIVYLILFSRLIPKQRFSSEIKNNIINSLNELAEIALNIEPQ